MSTAGNYLQKHALRGPLVQTPPRQPLHYIVVIPAYNESGLTMCLDSLFLCDTPGLPGEVIVLLNASQSSPAPVKLQNRHSYNEVLLWGKAHRRADLEWHAVLLDDLPEKHAGAGLARKLLMDEAVRRLECSGNPQGIILSLDADTTVERNYLSAVTDHFAGDPATSGCSIRFEHPLSGSDFPPEVYRAITRYELHLRYYLHAVRYTGFPYATFTIGSCFAVRAGDYCRQGGMNKRQAGEDFYFIQKLALLGTYTECATTTVYPSPRPSDRVIFGTGPDIARQLADPDAPYLTHSFELFSLLLPFFSNAGRLFRESTAEAYMLQQGELLAQYLSGNRFPETIAEMKNNAASEKTFTARFHRHFNMLWILKFLHYGEECGVKKMEVGSAAAQLLQVLGVQSDKDMKGMVEEFRKLG